MYNENDLIKLIKLSECPRLNEKYKDIAGLPLAMPKFELDSPDAFWHVWNQELVRVDRQHIDRGAVGVSEPKMHTTHWDGLAMYEDETLLDNAAWRTKVCQELADSQPNYVKSIFELMPFAKIRSIRCWSAHINIPPHFDGNMPTFLDKKMFFPTEIRIMLDDKNPTETFWLCSKEKYQPNSKVPVPLDGRMYVKLPSDTNAFAWNNENFLHGADFDPKYRKILVVVKGWVDIDRLEALLDASMVKYPNYVLREK
jgi:hypothetical protein